MRPTRKTAKGSSTDLRGAPKTALPAFVAPSLATLADKAPDSSNWVHEIKFDGYRIQARLERGKVKLLTRKGLDWTKKFPAIAAAVAKLPAKDALIDGELVAEGRDGLSSFSLLQQDLKASRHDRMVFYAFDLLHLDGADLRPLPLAARKNALAALVNGHSGREPLRFSESSTNQEQRFSATPARWDWKALCQSSPTRHIDQDVAAIGSRPNAPTDKSWW